MVVLTIFLEVEGLVARGSRTVNNHLHEVERCTSIDDEASVDGSTFAALGAADGNVLVQRDGTILVAGFLACGHVEVARHQCQYSVGIGGIDDGLQVVTGFNGCSTVEVERRVELDGSARLLAACHHSPIIGVVGQSVNRAGTSSNLGRCQLVLDVARLDGDDVGTLAGRPAQCDTGIGEVFFCHRFEDLLASCFHEDAAPLRVARSISLCDSLHADGVRLFAHQAVDGVRQLFGSDAGSLDGRSHKLHAVVIDFDVVGCSFLDGSPVHAYIDVVDDASFKVDGRQVASSEEAGQLVHSIAT